MTLPRGRGNGSDAPADALEVVRQVGGERILRLYAMTPPGVFTMLAAAGLSAAVLWQHGRVPEGWSWIAVAVVLAVGRMLLYRAYLARSPAIDTMRGWEDRYAIGTGLTGIAWAVLMLMARAGNPADELLLRLIAIAFAACWAWMLGPSPRAFLAFAAPLAAGLLASAVQQGDLTQGAVSAFAVFGLYGLWRTTQAQHQLVMSDLLRRVSGEDPARAAGPVFESTTVGVALVQAGEFHACNARLAELLGYTSEQLVNQSTRMLFGTEAEWNQRGREVDAAVAQGTYFGFEAQLLRRDGSRIWCVVQGRPVAAGDAAAGAIVSVMETGAATAIEEALREVRSQYELVVQGSQVGVWDWDLERDQVKFSPQFKTLLGYPADEDLSAHFRYEEEIHPDDRQRVRDTLVAHFKFRAPFECDYRLRRRDGEYVWMHGRGQAVWNDAGRVIRFAGTMIDISEQQRTKLALEHSEAHYRTLVETSKSLIWELDRDGIYTYVNERAARTILGYQPVEMIGRAFTDFLVTAQTSPYLDVFARLLRGEHVFDFQSRQRRRDGGVSVLSFNAIPLRDANGAIIGMTGTATDVTRRVVREEALKRATAEAKRARAMLRSAVESLSDAFAWFDKDDRLVLCNRRFAELYTESHQFEDIAGLTYEQLVRSSLRKGEVIAAEFHENLEDWVRERVARHQAATGAAHRYQFANGRWVQVTERRTPDGGIVGVRTDISELKRAEEEIRRLADLDPLTGLPNRRLLEDRLRQAISQAKRRQQMIAVLLIDMDNFKPINDRYGHRVGDSVLIEVARRLLNCVRGSDTVARYGGDEFVVVLQEQRTTADAHAVAAKIHAAMAMPFREPISGLNVSCSIGVGFFPEHGSEVDSLLRHADEAMYHSKRMLSERTSVLH